MKAAIVVAAAMFVMACQPNRAPVPAATSNPLSSVALAPTQTPAPSQTACAQAITPLVPALAFQNGNIDLPVRFALGSVRFFLAGCRDINATRAKYGLGPASLVEAAPITSEVGTRYYRAAVPVGEEAATVTRLASHSEDFQYVELDVIPHACAISSHPGDTCVTNSSVAPTRGPAGTSFVMTVCCWPAGTRVTKTLTTPSGKTVTITDVSGANETVPAGWGGSNTDEPGTYTVFVRDDTIGAIVRFTIT